MMLLGKNHLWQTASHSSLLVFIPYILHCSLHLKGTAGFILGACRQGICFVPVILFLPTLWGMNGILYAQPIADIISAIVTAFMALHFHKELAEASKSGIIKRNNFQTLKMLIYIEFEALLW